MVDKDELSRTLMDIGAVKFGEFTLTSGKKSPYYVDLRVIPSFPQAFDKVTDVYAELLKEETDLSDNDVLVGVPTAAVPFASVTSQKTNTPMIYVRKKAKEHGTKSRVEGHVEDNQELVVIEDLVSTGGSNMEVINALREEGYTVRDSVVLLDRMQGGVKRLKEEGDIDLKYAMNVLEMVDSLEKQDLISAERAQKVRDYTKGESDE